MTAVGIRCYAMADGSEPSPSGQWLKSFDPEAFRGRGSADWTADPSEALRFTDAATAFKYWKQGSRTRPIRPDGQPNRPLTAFTVEVLALP